VQVSPVLVRVADGTTRWAGEPTVVAPADAFAVQGVLATEVADALDVALAPAERTRLATVTGDTAAFAAVERGRRILDGNDTRPWPERLRLALPEFERAYRRDPNAAEAWSEASDVLQRMGQATQNTGLIDSAAGLARRALALDPGDARAVETLAVYELVHGRTPAARALIARAVRAHPSSAELRMLLAGAAYQSGDTVPAWPAAAEALRLAPRSLARRGQWVHCGARAPPVHRRGRGGRAAPGARPDGGARRRVRGEPRGGGRRQPGRRPRAPGLRGEGRPVPRRPPAVRRAAYPAATHAGRRSGAGRRAARRDARRRRGAHRRGHAPPVRRAGASPDAARRRGARPAAPRPRVRYRPPAV
jgi:tetratricopeptide (TPR) repeat protein